MSDKIVSSLFSALIGGIVGACVVFFLSGKTKFDALEVGSLKITKQATLINAEGKDDVMIKDGSVFANKVVVGHKFIGQQYQGSFFIGNRIFTSPDDLVNTPIDQWKFFTEIGSSSKMGGEFIVRSPHGANVVNQQINTGSFFRIGFDENNDAPLLTSKNNETGTGAFIPLFTTRQAAQQPNNNAETPPVGTTPAPITTPAPTETSVNPVIPTPPVVSVAENPGNAPK
ncbi:MAG: hypothetical protein LBF88_10340 [Planctomycetaceae bacterium]|jgi:hypothetical protein|nr:hypothetical protein [Planctomycetaceae bacterium]